ncbi:MAG TPA: tetratricopeptide repeat protein [Candidatus Kryptonia bacterium]
MKKIAPLLILLFILVVVKSAPAQDQLTMGRNLLKSKDCSGALQYLLRAVADDPRSAKVNMYVGEAYLCLGKLDSSELFLQNAVKYDDELVEAFGALGQTLALEKKNTDAIQYYKVASQLDPKNSSYVISLGNNYLAIDSLDNAMQAFYKARDMNDKNARAIEGIADVYREQGILDAAIDNYKEALTLDSLNVPLRLKLANTYMKNNDGTDAYQEFVNATQIEPNNAEAQRQAGEILYINKKYREAFTFLEKYHQLVPNDDKALLHLGESAVEGKFYPEAVKYYQEYLKKYPNSVEAKKNLAAAYFFWQKAPDAYNTFKSIPIDSMSVKDLTRFGIAAQAVKDTNATIDAWSHAVKLDTTQSVLENLLANTLFASKRYDQAIVHFQRHLAMTPDDVAAELNMGLCYIVVKDYPDAITALRRVVSIKPDNFVGTHWLALTYSLVDSVDEETEVYQNVIKLALADTSADHSSELNEAYRQIGFSKLMAGSKLTKDKPDEAKKYFTDAQQDLMTALKYDPKELKTHALLAQDYAFLGKIDDACKEIKLVLKQDPKNDQMIKLQKALNCE